MRSHQFNQYAANVGSPARQKQIQDEMLTANRENTSQTLANQRATMAQDYQSRLKNEHKNQLLDQLHADRNHKN